LIRKIHVNEDHKEGNPWYLLYIQEKLIFLL